MDSREKRNSDSIFYIKPSSRLIRFIILFITLASIALCIIFLTLFYDITKFDFKSHKKDFYVFLVTLLTGFAANVFASIFWDRSLKRYYEKKEESILDRIKKVANEDLLVDIYNELKSYEDRYIEYYRTDAHLLQFSDTLLRCRVHRTYETLLPKRTLLMAFAVIKNDNDAKFHSQYPEDEDDYEFYYLADERGFPPSNPVLASDIYKLQHVEINGENINIVSRHSNEHRKWEVQVPNKYKIGEKVEIHFEVEFFIPQDAYLFFSINYPTFDVRCELHFEEVKHLIDVYSNDFISSRRASTRLHSSDEPTRRYSLHSRWVMPRSTFQFIWYKKK